MGRSRPASALPRQRHRADTGPPDPTPAPRTQARWRSHSAA